MSYGSGKVEFVLGLLEDAVSLTGEIMDAFFDSYPSRRVRRGSSKRELSFARDFSSAEEEQRFYAFFNTLKRQGLIEKQKKEGRQSFWKITRQGLERLSVIREKKKFSPRSALYEPEKGSTVRVVIFDVPERERHKRVWLRAALLAMGFSFCQQSVWVGKSKIPKRFLEDLRDREMLSYVQIFEVTKEGSLERVSV